MQEANLAFFQEFYANVTLYTVAEEASVAVPEPALEAVEPVVAPAPKAEVVAAPVPVTPAPAPAPAAPAASLNRLPSLSQLKTPPAPAVPVSTPPPTPAVPVSPVSAAPAPPVRTAPPLTETPFTTLGSNPNGLLILVRMDPVLFQRLPRNFFLNNLLKAIRLVMEDVVLINVESHLPVALSTLRQKLAGKQIIAFGKNLLDVAVHKTQLYEPVLLVGDAAYLPAAEIELIEEDNSRKKLLWQAMQRMFLS
ncbi:hypothetical protein [Hymenobacter sp. BT730]|uniref:hypothetical protein n=1 Tax=Hymenobacter sp. BT730 TaxID=3063332 RepID=UPI0026DED762|nr:hypothetical protein [Hymenobacter sp. BT730]